MAQLSIIFLIMKRFIRNYFKIISFDLFFQKVSVTIFDEGQLKLITSKE